MGTSVAKPVPDDDASFMTRRCCSGPLAEEENAWHDLHERAAVLQEEVSRGREEKEMATKYLKEENESLKRQLTDSVKERERVQSALEKSLEDMRAVVAGRT